MPHGLHRDPRANPAASTFAAAAAGVVLGAALTTPSHSRCHGRVYTTERTCHYPRYDRPRHAVVVHHDEPLNLSASASLTVTGLMLMITSLALAVLSIVLINPIIGGAAVGAGVVGILMFAGGVYSSQETNT